MRINIDFRQKVDGKSFIALRIDGKSKSQHAVSIMTNEEIKRLEQDLLETVSELQGIRISNI